MPITAKQPFPIQAVIHSDKAPGAIVMTGLPGFEIARDGAGYMDPGSTELAFAALKSLKADVIYLLVEDIELPGSALEMIANQSATIGAKLVRCPIPDFHPPEPPSEAIWTKEQKARKQTLAKGGAVCLACLYGAGRSGMMAAATLVDLGYDAQDAVQSVRSNFSEAISNQAQIDWIGNHNAAQHLCN